MSSSWALFIMIMLLMFALFTSYILQQKKIQAVHETVLSIFAGRPYTLEGGGRLLAMFKAWMC
jgi:NhaP-type Na+/H+ or K+/H+ antiporter